MDFKNENEEDIEIIPIDESITLPSDDDFDDTLFEFKPSENQNIEIQNQSINEGAVIPLDDNLVNIQPEEIKVEEEGQIDIQDIPVLDEPTENIDIIDEPQKVNDVELFNNEFNKLQQEKQILEMNPELKEVTSSKTNTLEKVAVLLPIFAFFSTLFLGLYIFISNTNAEEINLIRIEENNKTGYINSDGDVIVRPKYISGTDFYKGYAIVKNHNSLSAVIDGKAKIIEPFGSYFYIERFGSRYIASRFTDNGLKLAILDSKLKQLTKYKYDNITYATDNTFLFTRDETMGILNQNGDEIYKYTVDEVDNKTISIEVSDVKSRSLGNKYAKIKINNTSTIISLSTGKEVYRHTLDDILVLDNNIFYIKSKNVDEHNRYIIIKDEAVAFETQSYKKVRIDDVESNIALGVKDDLKIDYINLKTRKKLNENYDIDYTYGDGIILEKNHDFNSNDDIYTVRNYTKTLSTFKNIRPVNGEFVNGMLKVYVDDNKYNFVNKTGRLLSNEAYDKVSDFDKNGYAIVSKDNLYGIINNKGKKIVPIKYEKLDFFDEDLFMTLKNRYNKELFVYYDMGSLGLIDSKGNIVLKAIYDSFKYITTDYPIILGMFGENKVIINLETGKDLNIDMQKEINVYENYIVVDKNYYNYKGKLIYELGQED